MAQYIQIESRDGIALVRLNRPPANPINLEVLHELLAAFEQVRDDASVRAVILTGCGESFSAGLDLKAVPTYSAEQRADMIRTLNRMITLFYGMPKPTVSAVDGHAIGGGLVLALAADVQICADVAAKLGLAEARAGIPFPFCAMEVVRSELAPHVSRWLSLTADNLSPAEALESGMFDEISRPEALLDRAFQAARRLADLPADSYAKIKEQLRATALERMRAIADSGDDPLIDDWLSGDVASASAGILKK